MELKQVKMAQHSKKYNFIVSADVFAVFNSEKQKNPSPPPIHSPPLLPPFLNNFNPFTNNSLLINQ